MADHLVDAIEHLADAVTHLGMVIRQASGGGAVPGVERRRAMPLADDDGLRARVRAVLEDMLAVPDVADEDETRAAPSR